ncbi:MAG: carboxypeptidase-like regulatory domain-containing protein [Candidatus Bathyarchaeia archaeon]
MNPSPKMAIVAVVIAVVVAASGFYFFQFGPPEERKRTGVIEGTVTDHDGNSVAGMIVYIVSGTTAFPEIAVKTNEEGYYRIGSVLPGTFEVAVHDRKGNRIGLESVTVRGGETSTLNFVIPTPTRMISFEEAVEWALKGGETRWKFSEYRWLGKFEGEPFVTPDGLVEGHLEWRASNGTLYEAEYSDGKIYGEIEHFTGVEDAEEYYVWKIILMDGASCHIDARSGELLSFSPSRVPGVLTFKTAVRVIYAPQRRVEEWRVQEYKRIGDFESKPYETPDGLVKGHLLWRVSNGALYEVMLPLIRDIRGKVLYVEVPDDTEEYNVWEITTQNNVYYIDARNGIIRLISESPTPTKEKGFLEGTVWFIGVPCPPEEISGRKPQVPPCDGSYPNYEITVYKTDGKTMVAKTVSDEDGNYKIPLNPGNYVIYTQNEPLKDDIKTNQVTIESEKTTKLDLIIDTGIR